MTIKGENQKLKIDIYPGSKKNRIRAFRIAPTLMIFFIFFGSGFAQKIKVDNIGFEIKDSIIEIHYDLVGQLEKTYNVSVELKREQAPDFSYKPKLLSGDVGKGKFAGNNRKIIWNFTNEFKPEAGISDYFFEVSAKKPGKAWIYIVAGGVVAGGATAAILLLTGKKDEPEKTFPVPVRP
jgi:hypothetical protein